MPSFNIETDGELRYLEKQIEENLRTSLRQSCFKEKSYRIFFLLFHSLKEILCKFIFQGENAIFKARAYSDEKMLKKAMDYEMPMCERLKTVFGAPV
jgi:hypothetical protein